MRCELLGVIPARVSVRHYCSPGTYLLDVSHVHDRKTLENITRGYSDRCSYASPFERSQTLKSPTLSVKTKLRRKRVWVYRSIWSWWSEDLNPEMDGLNFIMEIPLQNWNNFFQDNGNLVGGPPPCPGSDSPVAQKYPKNFRDIIVFRP